MLEGLADKTEQCLLIDRLGDIVKGSEAHGLGCRIEIGKTGNHHHRTHLTTVANLLEQLGT